MGVGRTGKIRYARARLLHGVAYLYNVANHNILDKEHLSNMRARSAVTDEFSNKTGSDFLDLLLLIIYSDPLVPFVDLSMSK